MRAFLLFGSLSVWFSIVETDFQREILFGFDETAILLKRRFQHFELFFWTLL